MENLPQNALLLIIYNFLSIFGGYRAALQMANFMD
jgi:hypothetical protein